jgi:hypothetical protein
MFSRSSFVLPWITFGITVLVLALLWIPGFGLNAKTSPRSILGGQVTYNGQPVTGGAIIFQPIDRNGRDWGSAILDLDGRFRLESWSGRNELVPGRYGIFFVFNGREPRGLSPRQAENDDEPVDVEQTPPPIPAKYTKPDTSGLWIDVSKEPNHVDVRLRD